ncbi:MAG: GIY-YIG nuclease family protein [Bacteroidetes bacterium]|nr:GIY-YIG nuclease family protein [Bacteroidota bacterium]
MASVYILYSESLDKHYTGSCKEIEFRIHQHLNNDLEGFTGRAHDWQLYFLAEGLNYGQARRIENHIKKMKSRKYLENLKKYPEIIEKLEEKYRG